MAVDRPIDFAFTQAHCNILRLDRHLFPWNLFTAGVALVFHVLPATASGASLAQEGLDGMKLISPRARRRSTLSTHLKTP